MQVNNNQQRFQRHFILFITFFLLFQTHALANGITGVLAFQFLHLLLGNLIIGVIEAQYVRIRFSMSINTYIIVLANYISMLTGLIIAFFTTDYLGYGESFTGATSDINLYRSGIAIWIIISFFVTLLAELPFYKWAMKSITWKQAFLKELEPNILTNTLVLLFYYFFLTPGT